MTEVYYPFDDESVTQDEWSLMGRAWLATGVVAGEDNNLEVYGDSTGMQVKVKSGKVWVKGHLYYSNAEQILSISASHATLHRYDAIVAEVDWVNSTMDVKVVEGTPASSPVYPTLTQTTSKWQIALAYVYIAATVTTITAGNVTDFRNFTNLIAIPFVIGDNVQTITTGVKGYLPPLRFDCSIVGWELVADASGSIVIDIWKDTYANYPPTVADTITASAKPTLSSATKNRVLPGGTLTGWTTLVSRDDCLGFNVDSATTVKQVTLILWVYKR